MARNINIGNNNSIIRKQEYKRYHFGIVKEIEKSHAPSYGIYSFDMYAEEHLLMRCCTTFKEAKKVYKNEIKRFKNKDDPYV